MPVSEHLKTFFFHPGMSLAAALLLAVLGWKMTASWANWLLVVALFALAVTFFRWLPTDLLSSDRSLEAQRWLWTSLFTSVSAIAIYYSLWTAHPELKRIANEQYREVVAEALKSFSPNALIHVGSGIHGPDGTRPVGITITVAKDSQLNVTLIDVYESSTKIGIDAVDSLETRKRDLHADYAAIFSNAGFDDAAMKKANRIGMGLLAVAREGDKRVAVSIKRQIYLRKIHLNPTTLHFNGSDEPSIETVRELILTNHDIRHEGGSIPNWMFYKAIQVAIDNPRETRRMYGEFNFMKPLIATIGGKEIRLSSVLIEFSPRVEWLTQVVEIDATSGIYDYLREYMKVLGQQAKYTVRGVNFDTAIPVDPPENPEGLLGPSTSNLRAGDVTMTFMMFMGIGFEPDPTADLDQFVRPEDLSTKIEAAQEGK